jgi:serine protease Do
MATRRTTLFYMLLIAVASVVVGMVIASRLDVSSPSAAQTFSVPPANSTPISGTIDALTFRTVAREQMPMVVNIRTESRRRGQELTEFFGGEDLLRRFFGQPDIRPRQPRELPPMTGAGSGFIIDPSGLILTNNHVVEGATKIEVGLFGDEDGTVYTASVIGRDPLTDSALIELTEKPAAPLPVARFGDSDQIEPGDWVMAIGNPFNLAHTVTVGVISAVGRPFPVTEDRGRWQNVIQTDAAINPGNSGGPLLNIRGEVVGISTAIYTSPALQANLGVGFAMPINVVRELLPQLREGRVIRGRIGVEIMPVGADAVEQFGLPERKGAVIARVEPDGPAHKAGLQAGDVILEFDGKPVQTRDDLVQMVVQTKPGTTVPVRIISRDKEAKTLQVTVEELDLTAETARTEEIEREAAGFGMTLDNLTPNLARQLRLPPGTRGAVVTDVMPRSAADRGGLRPRDIILEVNRQPVDSAAEAARELQRVERGRSAFLLISRDGQEMFLQVTKD